MARCIEGTDAWCLGTKGSRCKLEYEHSPAGLHQSSGGKANSVVLGRSDIFKAPRSCWSRTTLCSMCLRRSRLSTGNPSIVIMTCSSCAKARSRFMCRWGPRGERPSGLMTSEMRSMWGLFLNRGFCRFHHHGLSRQYGMKAWCPLA